MTNSMIPLETRRALGIADDAIVLLADHLPIDAEPMAGAGLISLKPLLAWLVMGIGVPPKQEPQGLPSNAAREVQLRLERYRSVDEHGTRIDVVRIFDDRGRLLRLRSVGTTEEPQVRVTDDFSVGVVVLPPGAGAVVEMPSGEKLIVQKGATGIDYELSLAAPPPDPVWGPSPVEKWSAAVSDPFVTEIVRDIPVTGDGWDVALAAGVFARLGSRDVRARSVDAILKGEGRRPYANWARTLGKEHVSYLTHYALAAADSLDQELRVLLDDFRPFDAEWLVDYAFACRRREELEGVCAVLSSIGAGDVLRTRLNILDEATSPFVIAFASTVSDPVLATVASVDPAAWWGAPANHLAR